MLKRLTDLTRENYAEQQEIASQFAEDQIDLNELIAISDSKALNERLKQYKLDETELTRVLEIIRERRTVALDIADLESDLSKRRIEEREEEAKKLIQIEKDQEQARDEINKKKEKAISATETSIGASIQESSKLASEGTLAQKALAIASATLNTYKGISNALALPAPLPFPQIQAALIGATGFANVANIVSTQVPAFAGGGIVGAPNIPALPNGDNVMATVRSGEMILNPSQQSGLFELIQANSRSNFNMNSASNAVIQNTNTSFGRQNLNNTEKALDLTDFDREKRRLDIEQRITGA